MSVIPPTVLEPSKVWNYSERTLTQSKFPFWSAIIEQTHGSVDVPASSSANVNIQPPSGETWLIWLSMVLDAIADGSYVIYKDYDGTTERIHSKSETGGTYGNRVPHLEVCKILTNSLYARLTVNNANASYSKTFYYGYSGFKLSKPIWKPKRLNTNSLAWKRTSTRYPIPSDVEPLAKYIVDIYDYSLRKYRQAIILEENTPLAVDGKGFPVERLTVICYVDVFIDRVLKPYRAGTLDLDRSGWRKYIEKWEAEGIKVL